MRSLPKLLLAVLAFAAAGPSCFTALMWGDSHYGMIGAPRKAGFVAVPLGAVTAFGRGDASAPLWLMLPPAVAWELGADVPRDAGWLVLAPDGDESAVPRLTEHLRRHARATRSSADDEQWPLQLVLLDEGGRHRWLLVGGERAGQLPRFGSPEELRSWLGDDALACAAAAAQPGHGDPPAAPWAEVAVVEMTRVDVHADSNELGRVGAKILLTPVTLVLDVVFLPFQLVMLESS